ncbi:putative LRR receptor-like serine/threonine-protein kinase [Vitis vinifera]|uniref:Putative LRR receptor-like serine/threonine-protein kinase n=1 Tax=Vitis vinifera TaxID=29760 RepID=A0A438EW50_VITVI|nr:putative LRR receptor-like serine/threonine-protein kinase [Vitis vinifera]
MDGRPTLIWLLIISLHGLGWVSGPFHGIQPGRRELTAREGFISIDCGIAPGSHYMDDKFQILYVSDEDFIDTGINYNVSEEYIDDDPLKQFMNIRSFPEGNKNCYTLRPEGGNKYLIRARFRYGNYDSKNKLPPADDVFDRIWNILAWSDEWDTRKAPYESSSLSYSEYKLPMSVMMDAVIPVDISEPWIFSLDLDDDPSQNLYIYMHFAEVQELGEGDIREFTVSLNEDDSWGGGEPVIPNYMVPNTLHHPLSMQWNYSRAGLKDDPAFPLFVSLELNTSSRCQEHPVSLPTDKTLARRSMSPLGFPMGWPAVQLQQ